jgi:putative ABC transport system ATP-binding protein
MLLADEPTGSLDSASKRLLLDLLNEYIGSSAGTFVVATHDPAVAEICGRIVELQDGRVLVQ